MVNGNTVAIITIREILIASLGLLLIPKSVDINIEDIIGKTKFLPVTGGLLEGEKQTVEKLNTVSQTISEIAKSYSEVAATTIETEEELLEQAKKYFVYSDFCGLKAFHIPNNIFPKSHMFQVSRCQIHSPLKTKHIATSVKMILFPLLCM